MKATARLAMPVVVATITSVSACKGKEPPPPNGSASSAQTAAGERAVARSAPRPAPTAVAEQLRSAPSAETQQIASTDVENPTPLASKSVGGTGVKKAVSYFVSIGNVTRDERSTAVRHLDDRQPVILRIDLDRYTIDWRAKLEGAIDFEPYEPPKEITIALTEKVLFDFGESTLKPESKETLHEAAARVKKYPTAPVTIAGHTDDVGSDAYNLKLSQDRAAAVRDWFVQSEAIPAERIAVKAFGKSRPVADNSTEEGRARNRRVEVVFIRK